MSTLTITEFLEARIAEDEAMARAVVDGPNWTSDEESFVVLHDDSGICYDIASEEVSQHIARHDPARVLAECAAKRSIIAAHTRQAEDDDPGAWIIASKVLLRTLAAVYKDHPDYDPEWAL